MSHSGAGYDQIDVTPFTERNIQVSNITTTVEVPTAFTADHLALSAMQNYQWGHKLLIER